MIPNSKFHQLLQEAVAHHKAGRLARADAIYRQLVSLAPRNAVVYDLIGQLAAQQGRDADALRSYVQACRLDDRNVPAAIRLANLLIAQNRAPEAEKLLRGVVARAPQDVEAWNALGFVLKLRGNFPEASTCHAKAVAINPKFVDGWCHHGLTLSLSGSNYQALQHFERALALAPGHGGSRFGRAQALFKIYRLPEALADYDTFLKSEPNHHEARSYRLFALQNLDTITREQLFAEHVAYGKTLGAGPASLPGYDLDPDRMLRLAILSPDFRTHSCAYFLEPLLSRLDPAAFELYLYHDHFNEDKVTARFKRHAVVWRNFVGQPNAAVERVIRADKPDILVDLTGHIGTMIRLPIFAKRLAPVQITYLGYPDTTGVAAMDYRFTDAIADPPGDADHLATEQLVRFGPTAWAYQPPADAPDVAPPPSARGQPVTFGCFSSPTKFTDSLFRAWARLLADLPGSRLRIKGRDLEEAPVREHMLRRMAVHGLPVDRVELLPRTRGTAEHLAMYGGIDIALDTFPYTGTTTTCEALWMGRPVVTLAGDRHAARVGASLLTTVGRNEWIARDVDDYVRIARQLAENPALCADAAQTLREATRRSALCDYQAQSARFATALRCCWRERTAARAERVAAA